MSGTTVGGTVTNTGTMTVLAGSSVATAQGAALNNSAGGIFNGIGTFNVSATNSTFINNGVIAPGLPAGILNIVGNTPFSGTAELTIEIGGITVGSEYDQLSITSRFASLAGTLNVSLINGFIPRRAIASPS